MVPVFWVDSVDLECMKVSQNLLDTIIFLGESTDSQGLHLRYRTVGYCY
jgi:hypothetical protein